MYYIFAVVIRSHVCFMSIFVYIHLQTYRIMYTLYMYIYVYY